MISGVRRAPPGLWRGSGRNVHALRTALAAVGVAAQPGTSCSAEAVITSLAPDIQRIEECSRCRRAPRSADPRIRALATEHRSAARESSVWSRVRSQGTGVGGRSALGSIATGFVIASAHEGLLTFVSQARAEGTIEPCLSLREPLLRRVVDPLDERRRC